MEKKNTILLTVIAIATLLVAVVGATFAYFTAQVTTTNDENKTTTVKTYALANAVMDMGSSVVSADVYPGAKIVKPVTVTGTCPSGNTDCQDVDAVIEVTSSIPTEFGTDVHWYLYKSTTDITCTNTDSSADGKFFMTATCQNMPDYSTAIADGTASGVKTVPVTVAKGTTDKYFLVVEYENKDDATTDGTTTSGNQNAQQGKTFTVTLDFKPAA